MNNISIKDYGLCFFLFILIFGCNLPMAQYESLTPDASVYLDMGRNIITGKGPIITFNLYQSWTGISHPSLPYKPPLYPIVAGFLWVVFNLKTVIGFNIFLLAMNCVLLYWILRSETDDITSFLIALIVGFSYIPVYNSIQPWTEHLHLFLILCTLLYYIRKKKADYVIGVLFGIGFLIRLASIYNWIAFMISIIILHGFSKKTTKDLIKVALGFIGFVCVYEIICYVSSGYFYPQYFKVGKTYLLAEMFPGAYYKNSFPSLTLPRPSLPLTWYVTNIQTHLKDFFLYFNHLGIFLILVPMQILLNLIRRQKDSLLIIFATQGFVLMVCFALALRWQPKTEIDRFVLIPLFTIIPLGLLLLKNIIIRKNSKNIQRGKRIVYIIIIMILFAGTLKNYIVFRKYIHSLWENNQTYITDRELTYQWIRDHSKKNTLIATEFIGDGVLMDRPVISIQGMPQETLRDFIQIYQPGFVVGQDARLLQDLKEMGFKVRVINGSFVVLEGKNT